MRRTSALALSLLVLCIFLGLGTVGCGGPSIPLEPGSSLWGEVTSVDGHDVHLTIGSMADGDFTAGTETVSVSTADAVISSDAGEALTTADLVAGDIVQVTVGENGANEVILSRSPEAVANEQGEAATVLAEDGTRIDAPFRSSAVDENALRVEGGTTTLVDCTVDKTGDPSEAAPAAIFGLDAAVLLRGGGKAIFDGGSITTGAEGGAGVFAYDGFATLNKTSVTTTRNASPALVATAGGSIESNGSTIATSGVSSPAVRATADGTAHLNGGEFVTSNYDAPVVVASSSVSAEGSKLTAAHSEMLVLEGSADCSFTDCSLAGSMDDNRGSHATVNVQGILLYQDGKMHGDPLKLSIRGGSLTNNAGDLIYLTNNRAEITLDAVNVQNANPEAALLRVAGNAGSLGWGESEANGGDATLTCIGQRLAGDLVADRISSLAVRLTGGSELVGAIVGEGGQDDPGTVDVYVEEGSTWHLTADSKIANLENHGTVVFDGHTLTLADGSVLGG